MKFQFVVIKMFMLNIFLYNLIFCLKMKTNKNLKDTIKNELTSISVNSLMEKEKNTSNLDEKGQSLNLIQKSISLNTKLNLNNQLTEEEVSFIFYIIISYTIKKELMH